jgi:gluconate 2-dehydrogenase gamma chain
MPIDLSRRDFLLRTGSGISAVWLSTHWTALLNAATHARQAAKSATAQHFTFFSPEEATEIDAISSRIIPSNDTPGAHEAGVVFFIDKALSTFATDSQKGYREGLPEIQARVHEMFPSLTKFSAATPAQQDEVLASFDEHSAPSGRNFRRGASATSFFETIRFHTVVAFLIDPESGGNRDGVGWKLIGRDPDHMFQPPFGYYDKDYAGWQPNPPDSEKAKA